MYGIPYGGGPKSGCIALSAPGFPAVRPRMKLISVSDCASSGAADTSRFHQLFAGKKVRAEKSSSSTALSAPSGSGPAGEAPSPPQAPSAPDVTIPKPSTKPATLILFKGIPEVRLRYRPVQ